MKEKIVEKDLLERYKDVPHFNLIIEDGYIEIPSIFMFEGGQEEYYPFLHACERLNCTVRFANEDIVKKPNESDISQQLKEMFYFQIARSPQIVEQYINFLFHRKEMNWDKV